VKEREERKRKANIRIFRRIVCNVLLPVGNEVLMGALGCLGVLIGSMGEDFARIGMV